MEKLLLKTSEAAVLVGVGRNRMYELLASGQIPSIQVGKTRRVSVEALRQWIAQQSQSSIRRRSR